MLRGFLKLISALLLVLGFIALILVSSGNGHVLLGVGKTYLLGKSRPDIDDFPLFDLRVVRHGIPQPWDEWSNKTEMTLSQEAYCESLQTVSFLVIKDSKIISEKYWEGYDLNTLSNSFSMAKSFTAMAVGHAIGAGYIDSLDQRVGDYLPEYTKGKDKDLTIRHLLQMSSGIIFGESYFNPLGYQAKAYYGTELEKATLAFHVTKTPGSQWDYVGGNTVLLGLIVTKATGLSLSEYFSQHIWSLIGSEHDAYWNLDTQGGLEKSFSAFYSTARDFARVGKLYLDSGRWKAKQIIPEYFRNECLTPVMIPGSEGVPVDYYGLHWWLGIIEGHPFYSCRGMRGQYIVVLPYLNAVVVRLGHRRDEGEKIKGASSDLWKFIEIATDLISKHEKGS